MLSATARTQAERRDQTRRRLVGAARNLFALKGFARTSTPDIVSQAGVTRGALYHHYSDKTALFAAVVQQERLMVAMAVNAAIANEDDGPVKALMAGCDAFLGAMQQQGRRQILLLDAPAVLGQAEAPAADMLMTCLHPLLRAGMETGSLRPLSVEVVGSLVLALFDRAAFAPPEAVSDYRKAIRALIRGLKA